MESELAREKMLRHLSKKNWSPTVILNILGQLQYDEGGSPVEVSDDEVIMIAAMTFNTTVESMKNSNKRKNAWARWFCYEEFRRRGYTCEESAAFFGTHHSAVSYGMKRLYEDMAINSYGIADMNKQFKRKVGRYE